MRLWESRMELLKTGSKDEAEELATFGWWLACGKFPDEWAIEQALPILDRSGLRPDFAVVEALDRLSPKYPYEAVRVVHVLFEEGRTAGLLAAGTHVDSILQKFQERWPDGEEGSGEMFELLVSCGIYEVAGTSRPITARGLRCWTRLLVCVNLPPS